MAVVGKKSSVITGKKKAGKKGEEKKRSYFHIPPEQPLIPAGQRGWWRLKHLLAFYGVSESEYRVGAKVGRYRKPDKYVGRIPFWNAEKF